MRGPRSCLRGAGLGTGVWESTEALSSYAYGTANPAHPDAIAADRAKPFHHQEAFIRFRPYASHGSPDAQHK